MFRSIIRPPLLSLTTLLVALAIALSTPACGQQPQSLRSEVSPTAGSVDDLFIFTVSYEGSEQRITPQVQTSSDFTLQLLGPKTSITILNGVIRSQQSFVYQLIPKREGSLKTPEVQVATAQGTLSAPPIVVTISAKGTAPGGTNGSSPTDQTSGDDLFLSQSATPKEVFLGQQIVNVIGVYSRLNLQGVTVDDEVADGFWQEVISDNNSSQKHIRGKDYAVLELARALFPLRTGDLRISPRKGTAKTVTTRSINPGNFFDPFGDGFFDSIFQQPIIKDVPLSSNAIPIKVKPLPPIPPELVKFSTSLTLVGGTSITMDAPAAVMKTGDTKAISITVRTEGNINPIKSIPLTAPPGMKIYDGQAQTTHRISNGRLLSERTFRYSLVALQPGSAQIPGASVVFFDPASEDYRLATTADLTILVSGPPQAGSMNSDRSATNVTQDTAPHNLIPTLPPLPVAPVLSYRDKTLIESVSERVSPQLSLLILAAVIALVSLSTFYRNVRSRSVSAANSLGQLAAIRDIGALENFLRSWLASRFSSITNTSSLDELRAVIRSCDAQRGHVVDLLSLIDDLELERYGHGEPTPMSAFLERLRPIVKDWDRT